MNLKQLYAALSVACVVSFASCSTTKLSQPSETSELKVPKVAIQDLGNTTAEEMFSRDLENNNLHFLAIQGYGVTIPGVPEYRATFMHKIPYVVIAGTTDAPRDDREGERQFFAADFAKQYNQLVLEYLRSYPHELRP